MLTSRIRVPNEATSCVELQRAASAAVEEAKEGVGKTISLR